MITFSSCFSVAYCLLGVSYYAVLLSEWMSVTIESEPSTNSADFDPMFPYLWNFPVDRVFFRVFYRNVAYLCIFGPSMVKYNVLSNNRRSELHAVIDCLFFFLLQFGDPYLWNKLLWSVLWYKKWRPSFWSWQ